MSLRPPRRCPFIHSLGSLEPIQVLLPITHSLHQCKSASSADGILAPGTAFSSNRHGVFLRLNGARRPPSPWHVYLERWDARPQPATILVYLRAGNAGRSTGSRPQPNTEDGERHCQPSSLQLARLLYRRNQRTQTAACPRELQASRPHVSPQALSVADGRLPSCPPCCLVGRIRRWRAC